MGKKKSIQTKGKSRAGISTKLHAAVSPDGVIIVGFLSGGEVNDTLAGYELSQNLAGCTVIADRGYDSNKLRKGLENQNCSVVIPGRKSRKIKIFYDTKLYKLRGFIERLFGKLKENRRLAMRFEKSDINFLSFIAMAMIKINL